jgi:error-prone DNA polymerase
MTPFVHLHVASGYSLRYGASTPEALVEAAGLAGQPALALTDRDGLYGAVRFVRAATAAGIAPVLGVDLAVAGSRPEPAAERPGQGKALGPERRTPARGGGWIDPPRPRVVLLARGPRGWASLCRLVSAAHLSGRRGQPQITREQIAEHAEGIVALLGPSSDLGWMLHRRRPDLADGLARQWREVLAPEALVVAVASHRAPDGPGRSGGGAPPRSSATAARIYGWARAAGLPTVLTNAVRHTDRAGAAVVDVLDSVRRLVPLDHRHLDRANAEGRLKTGQEMAEVAQEVVRFAGGAPRDAGRLLQATVELGMSCRVDPQRDLGIGKVFVPELDVVLAGRDAATAAGRRDARAEQAAAQAILVQRCEAGLHTRGHGDSRAARDRLAEELATIGQMGFAGYFLTVAEVVDLVRGMGVRVAARGSGAGSLVNHVLGISGVDPLAHGLLMERFLSPLRQALPDIDIDVESARRTEIYERILDRFGGQRCVCVSMMDTYRVRHAVRDVGAALALPPAEVDAFAKAFPHIRARDARAALRDLPELRSSSLGRQAARGELDRFLGLVESLDGLPRHIALHPCGVLLSDASLLDRTPVEASWLGFPMSQFDKDDVEELGLLKLDVLGIRMQSAMAHAVAEVERVGGARIDLDAIPLDDAATYGLIASTRTLGCFQIESPGQRELIGKFGPETFDDIIIDISLFRPGPVKSDMVNPFLRARQGWSQAEYLHPDLRPVLEQTAGVVVFHEQVMEIIAITTGCSLARADEARRALGSAEGQQAVRGWYYQQALQRYGLEVVEQIWDVLVAFASFGFCKAHAAAFALPTYQSAWLKTHHPAAFLSGVLTHDPGMYPKRLILDDARHFGVAILPIDVNASDDAYRVEPVAGAGPGHQGIRLPFGQVKGISDGEVARITANRPYASLADFWQRAGVSRPVAESLVVVGAFDSLYGIGTDVHAIRRGDPTRRDLLLQLADLERYGRALSRAGGARRRTAPAGRGPGDEPDPALLAARQSQGPAGAVVPDARQLLLDLDDAPGAVAGCGLPEMGPGERVRAELEVLGLDVSHHVLDFYRPMLDAIGATPAVDLVRCRSKAHVLVAGMKVATQTPPVRSGRRVVFLTVDDGTGPADATFFEDAQGAYAGTVFQHWLLLVRGEVRRTGRRGVSVRATGAWDLHEVQQAWQRAGAAGVHRLLEASPSPGEPAPAAATGPDAPRRRMLVHASGFETNVYADVRPAGDDVSAGPPSKLWHASPGSSGW